MIRRFADWQDKLSNAQSCGCLLLCLLFFLLVIVSIVPIYWFGLFEPLPRGASNGRWSRMVVRENQYGLAADIAQLESMATLIIRARIGYTQNMVLERGDTVSSLELISLYQLEVLEVYKGDVSVGDTIVAMQPKAFHGHSLLILFLNRNLRFTNPSTGERAHIDFIRQQFETGDDMILFLRKYIYPQTDWGWTIDANRLVDEVDWFSNSAVYIRPLRSQHAFIEGLYRLVNPVQAAYLYPPIEIDTGDSVFLFPSVDEYNNINLFKNDLLRIQDMRRVCDILEVARPLQIYSELEGLVELRITSIRLNWLRSNSINFVIQNNSELELQTSPGSTFEVYYMDKWRYIPSSLLKPNAIPSIALSFDHNGLRRFSKHLQPTPPLGEGLYRIRKSVWIKRDFERLHEIVAEFHWDE